MLKSELARQLGIRPCDLSKYIARGCPIDDTGKAKLWIQGNVKTRQKHNPVAPAKPLDLPPIESPAPDAAHTWEARLERLRAVEVAVYQKVASALDQSATAQLPTLLASHVRASENIAAIEKQALETRVQTGELIHRDTVRAILAEVVTPLRNALDLLPITERSRCNPAQPETAEAALRAWRDALLVRLSAAETKF